MVASAMSSGSIGPHWVIQVRARFVTGVSRAGGPPSYRTALPGPDRDPPRGPRRVTAYDRRHAPPARHRARRRARCAHPGVAPADRRLAAALARAGLGPVRGVDLPGGPRPARDPVPAADPRARVRRAVHRRPRAADA